MVWHIGLHRIHRTKPYRRKQFIEILDSILSWKSQESTTEAQHLPVAQGFEVEIDKKGDAEQTKTILIVDDDIRVLKYLESSISDHPTYQTVTANDGTTALAELHSLADQNALPALVISDLRMPGMDGVKLLRNVKRDARLRSIPFVLITAYGTDDIQDEIMTLGADGFLMKPFTQASPTHQAIQNPLTSLAK